MSKSETEKKRKDIQKMKYTQTFEFFASEKEAIDFCETYKKRQTRYMAKHHPPFYTPWSDRKGFDGFVVWYYI